MVTFGQNLLELALIATKKVGKDSLNVPHENSPVLLMGRIGRMGTGVP